MSNFVKIDEVLRDRKALAEAHSGCKVIFTSLFGSQNYGLDNSDSDVDCVCVTIPTIDNLLDGRAISKTLFYQNGQTKLMDLRNFAKQLELGSPVNLESLFSKYCIIDDEFKEFYSKRYDIYIYFHPEFRKVVYCCIRSIIKKLDNTPDDKRCKLAYEALRLGYLYKKIREESFSNLTFYVDDLHTRCELGLIKCGDCTCIDSKINQLNRYLDEKDCKSSEKWFNDHMSATRLAKDIILNSVLKNRSCIKENI